MAFKFVTFLALVAVARAGVLAPAALSAPLGIASPVANVISAAPLLQKTILADPNPQYSFSYAVSDALTGDQKWQQESRNGDLVQGSYSLVDPDGLQRTVDYVADPIQGFNAAVRREPIGVKAIAAQPLLAAPVAKTIISQPALSKTIISQPALSKTIISQPAISSYASPLVSRSIISQPALASIASPLAARTILSQPAISAYASPLAAKTILSQPAYY
ncbi:cuticle protein-like [Armigeres subalbatus]|uniref:cuticle protein-like n=1 Tax=Armigeres subalbatus TaxID=124917 RepID=UPI002ED4D6CB